MSLFARYPRFAETSINGAGLDRLNLRHQAIIDWNRDLLEGARVLDLASHDGRWSFAALHAGAAHVLGVEARPTAVGHALETFREYGVAEGAYEFRTADLFDELRRGPPQVDVVMLLGILYHVFDQVELARLVAATGARHVIVDTQVIPEGRLHRKHPAIIALKLEPVANPGAQAVANTPGGSLSIVGHPSRAAIRMVFEAFGFEMEEFDWPGLLAAQGRPCEDVWHYEHGSRATFRMTRRDAEPASDATAEPRPPAEGSPTAAR